MPGSELPSPAIETESRPGMMETDGLAGVLGDMPHFLKVLPPSRTGTSMQNVSLKASGDGKVELENMGNVTDERPFFFRMHGKDVEDSSAPSNGKLDDAVLVCIETCSPNEESAFVGVDYVQSQCGLCTDVVLKVLTGRPADTTYVAAMERSDLLWYKAQGGITPTGYATFTLHPHFSRDVVLCCEGENKLSLLPSSDAQSQASTVFTTFFWEPIAGC